MAIKQTILGFIVAVLLVGTTICQASKVTVTPYNHVTDDEFAQAECRRASPDDYKKGTIKDDQFFAYFTIRDSGVPVGLILYALGTGVTTILMPLNRFDLMSDAVNCLKKIHNVTLLVPLMYGY